MGFNCLKATGLQSHFEETLYFLPFSSQDLLVLVESTSGGWRLSQPWSYPVVLNLGPLDWESTAITTRPLLHCFVRFVEKYSQISLLIDFWNLDISTLSPFPEHMTLNTTESGEVKRIYVKSIKQKPTSENYHYY